jgi:hypothetical protein
MLNSITHILKRDGILLILWGWVLFYGSMKGFIERSLLLSSRLTFVLNVIGIAFVVACILVTVYYVLNTRRKVKTSSGTAIIFLWLSFFGSMVLVNLILFNVLQYINFELQHSMFMLLMAISVSTTGAILNYRLVIVGGVIFGLLAFIASYFQLAEQLLVEAMAWTIAFIIPGIIMYYKNWRSNEDKV